MIIEHPFGVLLNKSLYCMFPDPFLPRVAVKVGKGSGYARLEETQTFSECGYISDVSMWASLTSWFSRPTIVVK